MKSLKELFGVFALMAVYTAAQPAFSAPVSNSALNSAKQMLSTGLFQKAIGQLDIYLDKEPDCAEAHYYKAQALHKIGKKNQARDEYEAALLLDSRAAFAPDCQKHLLELNSKADATPAFRKDGKNKVFMLHGEQTRINSQVSEQLKASLNSEIADLHRLAMGSSAVPDDPVQSPAPTAPGRKPLRSMAQEDLLIPEIKLSAMEAAQLSKHDVIFIFDHSGSMSSRDCPGKLSRWAWVQAQLTQTEKDTRKCLARGVTAVFFDSNADEFRQISSDEMLRQLNNFGPRGGTNTGHAFNTQIENVQKSLSANHPVIIIAITDGLPASVMELQESIDRLSQVADRQRSRLKIAFLQIGSTQQGLQTLKGLQDMISTRQKDMVHVHPFEEVCKDGLTRTILNELK